MESTTATGIIVTIAISVTAWLVLTTINHKSRLSVLSRGQDDINNKLNSVVESIKSMNTKLDTFLSNELQALKDLSKASTRAIEKLADKK